MPSGASDDCGRRPSLLASSFDGSSWMALPSRVTCPALAGMSLARALRSVDLPQAFGPTITVKEPSGIDTSTPSIPTRSP